MCKLLIWDIDGTLLHCGGSGKNALEKTFEERYSISKAFDAVQMAGKMDKNILEEALEKNNLSKEDIHDIISHYGVNLRKELENNREFKLLQNIKINLHKLSKDNRIYNVIATGNSEVGGILKLKKAGLDEYFSLGSFGNHFTKRGILVKNAINVARFSYDIDFKKENIYMIGDTPDDILAGKENEIRTMAVATGGYSKETLAINKPDYLFDTLPENLMAVLFNGGD
jgi:phosphoglycolate phosphatase-like HAD superfamily hydrolase